MSVGQETTVLCYTDALWAMTKRQTHWDAITEDHKKLAHDCWSRQGISCTTGNKKDVTGECTGPQYICSDIQLLVLTMKTVLGHITGMTLTDFLNVTYYSSTPYPCSFSLMGKVLPVNVLTYHSSLFPPSLDIGGKWQATSDKKKVERRKQSRKKRIKKSLKKHYLPRFECLHSNTFH